MGLVASALASVPALAAATPATPIQSTGPTPTLPALIGRPAVAHPVTGVSAAWQNPFMAGDPCNSVHNDAWASDNYTRLSGPLGHHLQTLSTAIGRDCITLTFDHEGRLISTCTDLNHGPGLYLLDPHTLDTLAFKQLPYVPPPREPIRRRTRPGGAYFYLDNHDRVVVAASNRQILVFGVAPRRRAPVRPSRPLRPDAVPPRGDRSPSVLPDALGRIWFVGR